MLCDRECSTAWSESSTHAGSRGRPAHVWDHRDAWSIVREVDHPSIGLILDSFHSLARNIPNDSLREIDPARIFIVQLADAPVLQMDFLSWSRHFRNLPGQGELPIVDYAANLLERGLHGNAVPGNLQ